MKADGPLRLALLWVWLWGPLVPASRRATWRDQWRADLWHYWGWLQRQPRSPAARVFSLLSRAAACLPHAALLRIHEWSLHMLLHDLKFAWRMTVRRPAFTAVAVLILGLGIGANATIYSWARTVLLEPLPGVGESGRLVALRGTTASRADLSFSYPNYADIQAARPAGIEDVIAFRAVAMNLRAGDAPARVWGQLVTPNFFDVLRVRPALGRGLHPTDATGPGTGAVVVLSHAGWRRYFNADPAVIGRTVTINARAFTVVGVAPEGFNGSIAGLSLDLFVPMTMQRAVMAGDRLAQRGSGFLQVIARLAPGASRDEAQAALDVVAARLAAEHPDINEGRGIAAVPLWRDGASGLLLPMMATLMGVVGVVLLIACANLAGLLLARAAGRQREIAVRLSVGASRARIVRQLLVESVLLAAAGGAAGVAIAYWTSGLLAAFIPPTPFPVNFEAGVGPSVLLFAALVTLVTAVGVGLLPALRASRPDVTTALKESAGSASPARGRLRASLVVAQVALSVVLLVSALLFVRSLSRAQLVDPGFDLRTGVLASIDLLPNGYDEARGVLFYQQLLQGLASVPGIEAATVATNVPMDLSSGADMTLEVDGYQPRDGEEVQVYYNRIGPGYFATMGIDILKGRAINEGDVEGQPLAVVINETMARRYWDGRDPIGGRVRFGQDPAIVVGVARDGKYGRINEQPRNYMYLAIYQYFRPDVQLHLRTAVDPDGVLPALRAEVARLDPNLPLFDMRTVEDHLRLSVFIPRMAGTLLAVFGVLALALAVVGLYSVMAFNVAHRTQEIGVRMALGARPGEVVRMVVRQGVWLAAIGLGIGLALAAVAARLLEAQLVGVSAADPVSYVATIGILAAVALAACLGPARRAARLDPVMAIRRE